jgi:hypothetical protein
VKTVVILGKLVKLGVHFGPARSLDGFLTEVNDNKLIFILASPTPKTIEN